MKRLLAVLLVVLSTIVLIGCTGKSKLHDGEFTAFKYAGEEAASDLTWVTVTVEKGEVVSYYIDVLQYKNGAFLEKSKKELGFDYGMVKASPIGKEWFEQAEVIEAAFLKDGPGELSLDGKGYIDGLTGATVIGTTYKEVTLAALDLAKVGNNVDLPDEIKNRLD